MPDAQPDMNRHPSTPLRPPLVAALAPRDRDGRARSAAAFLTLYLGVVVGFGALMGQLVNIAGG